MRFKFLKIVEEVPFISIRNAFEAKTVLVKSLQLVARKKIFKVNHYKYFYQTK
jgi:hypothetical protein